MPLYFALKPRQKVTAVTIPDRISAAGPTRSLTGGLTLWYLLYFFLLLYGMLSCCETVADVLRERERDERL
jgi:hypothetical protein